MAEYLKNGVTLQLINSELKAFSYSAFFKTVDGYEDKSFVLLRVCEPFIIGIAMQTWENAIYSTEKASIKIFKRLTCNNSTIIYFIDIGNSYRLR
jgi:hypothetical protein